MRAVPHFKPRKFAAQTARIAMDAPVKLNLRRARPLEG
jgi:hypothetical protein